MRKLCARVLNLDARHARKPMSNSRHGRAHRSEHAIAVNNSKVNHWRRKIAISALLRVAIVLKIASQYFPRSEPWLVEPY